MAPIVIDMDTTITQETNVAASMALCDIAGIRDKAEKANTAFEGACFSLPGTALPGRLQVAAIIGRGVTEAQIRRGVPCVSSRVALEYGGISWILRSAGDDNKAEALEALAAKIEDGPDNILAADVVRFCDEAISIIG